MLLYERHYYMMQGAFKLVLQQRETDGPPNDSERC
jgi:hypothetical protein